MEAYKDREQLLQEAFFRSKSQKGEPAAVSLKCLVALMREASHSKKHLSSIYFAGAENDHPYFLSNAQIAVGIAILPEDREKAGVPKRHPHQTEVIFVLEGSLCIEVDGLSGSQMLTQGSVMVIPKDSCHRITPCDNQKATYLFVKTNPAEQPREEHCEL